MLSSRMIVVVYREKARKSLADFNCLD